MKYCQCQCLTLSVLILHTLVSVVVDAAADLKTASNTSWGELDMYSKCRKRPTWKYKHHDKDDESTVSESNLATECAEVMGWTPRSKYWEANTFNWFTNKDKEDGIMEDHDRYDDEDRRNYQEGGMEQIMRICIDRALEFQLAAFVGSSAEYADFSSTNEDHYDAVKRPTVLQKFNYDNTPNETALVQIEAALTNEEALTVQAIAFCVKEYFEDTNFEYRSFSQKDDDEQIDGNYCTYMDHFMQIFAPGISAQMKNVAYLAWQEADGWNGKYEDPKTLGVRTTEHLHYKQRGRVSFHDDPDSVYTIVVSLRRPEEYIGGEFLVADWEGNEMQRVFKGPRLSAVVFVSEELLHAVGDITGGIRETFATELWVHDDVTYGPNGRPTPDAWESFLEDLKELVNETNNEPESEL